MSREYCLIYADVVGLLKVCLWHIPEQRYIQAELSELHLSRVGPMPRQRWQDRIDDRQIEPYADIGEDGASQPIPTIPY